MKTWNEWSKRELLKLPQREWEKVSEYSSVLLVNTRYKHDSGFNLFAVIGVDENGFPVEIAGYMDDFRLDYITKYHIGDFSINDITLEPYCVGIDCSMGGVFRIHAHKYNIVVGCNLSTTRFEFKEVNE